ncbi:MAG: transglycosylase SLT domain-containing protein [Caulobacterales bacterium]
MKQFVLPLAAVLALSACATVEPPQTVDNACSILSERPGWWRGLKRAENRWGAPPGLILAIMRQESSFQHNARPPREDGFLFFPGRRPSSAFGYAQALDQTWAEYQRDAGEGGADRDEFRDAADFIGWYTNTSRRRLNLDFGHGEAHYLAYHEGHGGYSRGTFRQKAWLQEVARRVGTTASTYQRQIEGCEADLNRGWLPFF